MINYIILAIIWASYAVHMQSIRDLDGDNKFKALCSCFLTNVLVFPLAFLFAFVNGNLCHNNYTFSDYLHKEIATSLIPVERIEEYKLFLRGEVFDSGHELFSGYYVLVNDDRDRLYVGSKKFLLWVYNKKRKFLTKK